MCATTRWRWITTARRRWVLAGAIENGRHGGAWDRAGIVTSMSAAKAPETLATLGIAEAGNVVNFGGGQTAIWDGQTVDTSAVLIRYTFAGDANLDGVINGDDYFDVDAGYASQATGYLNGDFNYDGRVDADDYFLIDSNYGHAQMALAMNTAAPAAGAELPRNMEAAAGVNMSVWEGLVAQNQEDVLDALV